MFLNTPNKLTNLITLLNHPYINKNKHSKQIHSLLIGQKNLFDENSIHGDISYSSLPFHRINATHYNSIFRDCALQCRYDQFIAHYLSMFRRGIIPNKHTYPLVLKLVSKSEKIDLNQVHVQILKYGYGNDSFVRNSLIAAYAKFGELETARKLFDEMSSLDPISWTAMIHGCVGNGLVIHAFTLFCRMRSLGVQVGEMVIVSVLKGCTSLGNFWLGRCVHGFYVVCGRVKLDIYVGSALVDMYGKCGYCDDARQMFDEMLWRNVVTWNTMMSSYIQCHRYVDALSLFHDMLVGGIQPNQYVVVSALTACAQMGSLEQGRSVHNYVLRNKLEMNSEVATSLIDMYSKCGCVDDAIVVFQSIDNKSNYSWSALINGLAMNGRALESLDYFSLMLKDDEVKPNDVTFIGILSACSHAGLVDQGKCYFNSMLEDYNIRPRMEHYGCMVDLLGRAGRLHEALNFIQMMPMEASPGVWGALLNGCMIHKDFELGGRVGKHLIEIDPYHSGSYSLFANLCSISNFSDIVANVRMTMKIKKVEKIQGCSWIVIYGLVNEFITFDASHPESSFIYEALNGLTLIMKLKDFTPIDSPMCELNVTSC